MVETRRSSAAKHSSPSPSSSAPPPKRLKAEAPASPTTSAPGRTEEDTAAAAAARSTGSAEDAAAKKDQGGDKLAVAAAESSRKRKEQQQQAAPWAKLLSQCSQNPHLPINVAQFLVGQSKSCNLWLKDQPVSKILCKLRHLEQGGQCELEVVGKKGMVQLNGRSINHGTKVPLKGGDEVVFSSCGKHAYIFQHPLNDKVPKAVPSSAVSLLEPPVAGVKRIRMEKRTGGTSAVAGTEMLASVSNQLKDLPVVPPASAGENNERVVRPTASSASDK